uniref:Uncharacterized protein n=1 Tax=Fibrocapsa japonica TaxID=94617 RepID=A0A7S2XXL6_9STRA|mmetsp:Transcript_19207/g.27723  ORF Transcript_19207/g.27723 Transcript_19207/m.27723 type:complete len:181 (+) Transcript_19207:117-659(+)
MIEYRVDIYSLDRRERYVLSETMNGIACGEKKLVLNSNPLSRTMLKDMVLCSGPDMIILCHYNEGRLLLTDQDGLYNNFIKEAVKATGGNVFLVVTGLSSSGGVLADKRVVSSLVSNGQSSIQYIDSARRLLTWDGAPSRDQLEHLQLAVRGKVDPLETPETILRHCFAKKVKAFYCVLL